MNLDAIERRANAATHGPWGALIMHGVASVHAPSCYVYTNDPLEDTHPDTIARWGRDAIFIASARTDVPALIARVRELEEAWSAAEAHGLHTEGIRDLADALGIREGKMTADGVARHALQRVRELEAECERLKAFAAQNFSAMIRQEAEQMREYGLSYEGVRKVLHEYNDGEISFGKLMDLIRAAARAMAEDMKK